MAKHMQENNNNINRIPRSLVENDPSWEKLTDSDTGMVRFVKKGTQMQAVCSPTSMFCEIVNQNQVDNYNTETGLGDITNRLAGMNGMNGAANASGASDIKKYLSSRYLNPGFGGPRLDPKRFRRFEL